MPALDSPVVMVGTGRCGSTMLHRILALHPDLGWLSTFNEVFPGQAWLSRFSNLYRSPLFSRKVKHLKFFPKPYEAYRFWEHYLPGFRRRSRPLTADDVPMDRVDAVRRAVSAILAAQGRDRFLVKVTGWARMAYFDRVFPGCRFINLEREHRAVLSSWIQAGWLDVTSGLDSEHWQWGEVPAAYRDLWKRLGATPLLSAAVKIRLDLDDIRRNSELFPDRVLDLRYEDLIRDPEPQFSRLAEFCGLRPDAGFEAMVRGFRFHDTTDKWRRHLSDEEGETVLRFFEESEGVTPRRRGR